MTLHEQIAAHAGAPIGGKESPAWARNSTIRWRKLLILYRDVLQHAWCKVFPKHDFGTGRLHRYSLDSFEHACDRAEAEAARARARSGHHHSHTRPTPAVTIEAIWQAVRERGLDALNEPANQQRLKTCDAAARAELGRRIDSLKAGVPKIVEAVS
jgi:hypothetical protein